MPPLPPSLPITRRTFLRRSALWTAGSLTAGLAGMHDLRADSLPLITKPVDAANSLKPVRVVFATDAHLMVENTLGSAAGLAMCVHAIEALQPKPDLILFGGDLTQESPALDFAAAERLIDHFLGIWKDHTALPTHYAFGNHDFVGTKNPAARRGDPRFGKGLFRQRLGLEKTFYAFDAGAWRFVVLDDVESRPDGTYVGEFVEEQLAFLRADLAAHPNRPVALCGHIPAMSVLPTLAGLAKAFSSRVRTSSSLVAQNPSALIDAIAPARSRVKLVLSGHLHYSEQMDLDGTRFLTSGAICGNWWRGPQAGCPEGFTVLDLQPDGTHSAVYQPYGWKAVG